MINYDDFLNESIVSVKPSGIRKFFSIAEEMDNVISLGVGEPDFLTPWHIRSVAIDYLDKGLTRYTSNSGMLPLREEICRYLTRRVLSSVYFFAVDFFEHLCSSFIDKWGLAIIGGLGDDDCRIPSIPSAFGITVIVMIH